MRADGSREEEALPELGRRPVGGWVGTTDRTARLGRTLPLFAPQNLLGCSGSRVGSRPS